MRFFPRRHTLESVAAELIAGLANGTAVPRPDLLNVPDAIAESLRIAREINAVLSRLGPEYTPSELPTAESLASVESRRPGSLREFIDLLTDLRAELQLIEAEARHAARLTNVWRVSAAALAIGLAAYFSYLCVTNPAAALLGGLFGLACAALSFRSRLLTPVRNLANARGRLLAAVDDLTAKARSLS